MKILHCFADVGVESEALSAYGDVYRVGIDPSDTNQSEPIKANAKQLPIKEGVRFDLGLFHPPCLRWSKAAGEPTPREEYDNLIPLARELGKQYCENYIIENVVNAPLQNAVKLNGRMFGLPLRYERAFETNYHVPQPPRYKELTNTDTIQDNDRCDDRHNKTLWKNLKGYSRDYTVYSIKNASCPRAYINYLVRPLL